MARIPRSAFALEPGYFHLITRGNNGVAVFQDDLDYQHYLSLLRHYKRHFQVGLLAYSLMPNHVHMLVNIVKREALPKFMHGLNLAYSQYYKGRYSWNGHLWQGRYKSYLIEKDKYLTTCIEYIEANPEKAGLVQRREAYVWSSAKERFGKENQGLVDLLGTV